MSVNRTNQARSRRSGRRPMGMPDPMMVIGAGVVVLIAVLIGIFSNNRSAQSQSSPTDEPQSASAALAESTEAFRITRIEPTADALATTTRAAASTSPAQSTPTASATLSNEQRTAKNWQRWPVVPQFTDGARKIFLAGQESGRNGQAFSKVGDCESSATWFLEDFDQGAEAYNLGDYTQLDSTIEFFAGSYGRTSLAARDGARVSTFFTSLWTDPTQCETSETPLECEIRLHNPAFAIISLGSNDIDDPDKFEQEMRKLVKTVIELDVVPILATKADDLEGGGRNNQALAKLALEFDIPLWNFWAAVQDVPNGGLDWDGAHLTWSDNYFDQPGGLNSGWAMRNLTALQLLEAMRVGVQALPTP